MDGRVDSCDQLRVEILQIIAHDRVETAQPFQKLPALGLIGGIFGRHGLFPCLAHRFFNDRTDTIEGWAVRILDCLNCGDDFFVSGSFYMQKLLFTEGFRKRLPRPNFQQVFLYFRLIFLIAILNWA